MVRLAVKWSVGVIGVTVLTVGVVRAVPRPGLVASIDSNLRWVVGLSAMSIRNLDERVKERLRVRAARHGRSMEAEARAILTEAVSEPGDAGGLAQAIIDRFGAVGGVELDLPPRAAGVRAAEFH
jgi:antitoxin FitA